MGDSFLERAGVAQIKGDAFLIVDGLQDLVAAFVRFQLDLERGGVLRLILNCQIFHSELKFCIQNHRGPTIVFKVEDKSVGVGLVQLVERR